MKKEKISFKNEKNDTLTGYYFNPESDTHQQPILFATGTGIKQSFYMKFCTWLCEEKNHPVFIFDFNDIGESLFIPLKESKAAIRDWGQYDIPAAIDLLCQKTGVDEIILVGHSVGGQLMGIVHNYEKISKITAISSSTGFVGNMLPAYRRKALFFFNIYIPICNFLFGYTKSEKVNMGENLPKEVARE
ncbi:hypothetical protein GKC56_05565 [Neisseriaceae bacterium PsAf]|nr:hypothetical protein [Neisseriaceae bacterium PsAf]